MEKYLQEEIDLEDPTLLSDQLSWGCTQREAKVFPQAVQSKTELFTKLTTTRDADEKDQTKEKYALAKITARSFDMKSHAEKCYDRNCELPKKDVSTFQQVATPCWDENNWRTLLF